MGGLIYKDCLGVKGKRIIAAVLIFTLIFVFLRLLLPGADMTETASNDGNIRFADGDMIDGFLWTIPFLIAVIGITLPSIWVKPLIAQDEKNKIRAYTKSMPLAKNTYIASKYAFLAVVVFAALLTVLIWCRIYFLRAGDNSFTDLVKKLQSFLIVISSASLLLAGIELPVFLSLGSKKAVLVKNAFMELLFLFVIGWFFFGNLNVFEKIDLFTIKEWIDAHEVEMKIMKVISPLVALTLYFLSYKLTCLINRNKDSETDS